MGYGNEEVFLSPQQRENLIQAFLGKTVTVVIDRPIGFHHVTKGIHLDYTVNYGFLPGVTGGDGEEQDVYVLGVQEPLERFTGTIIGAVRRRDDNEDKLVAAPEGIRFTAAQIAKKIERSDDLSSNTMPDLHTIQAREAEQPVNQFSNTGFLYHSRQTGKPIEIKFLWWHQFWEDSAHIEKFLLPRLYSQFFIYFPTVFKTVCRIRKFVVPKPALRQYSSNAKTDSARCCQIFNTSPKSHFSLLIC